MIVKNEAHIIRRTLAMLCSKIRFDYWVICDTGSTDATPEIVQDFFATEGIEGELHCDAWTNFAHNRTLALNYAFGKTDLLLVFDADDDICGAIALPPAVTHDEYQLKFGSPRGGGVSYVRTLLINNRKRFKYFSVVHEYISCLEPSAQNQTRVLDGDYCVVSGRGGARNRDPDKYLKDALLLEAAHAEAVQTEDPLYKRYAFYCANSYRDCGQPEDAIRWYKVTLSQDNWAQEKYLACLHLYRCYESLGQKEHGFYYLVKAFAYDAERVECLHPLVVHYCCEGMNEVAHGYYRMVQAHYEGATLTTGSGESKLFFEPDKANFFLPYYMIIVADRVGDRACGIRMYEIIFTKKEPVLSAWHLKNLVFNLRFFIGHVKPDALAAFVAQANEYLHTCGVSPGAFADVSKDFNYAKWGIVVNANAIVKPVISPNFSRSECEGSKAILLYAGYSDAPWNYSSMLRGALGGSERAVANLSRELYRQGYTVYVSGGVLEDDAGVGVKYVGLSGLPELLRTTAFHTIVCSRYVSFLELHGGIASWYRFYVWAHDTHLLAYGCDLSDTAIIEKWSDRIDGCVCQTRWHADEYAHRYPTLQPQLRVINNGIDPTMFPALGSLGKKVPGRFIYTSRTERGLSRILDLWPDIIAAMPDATLVISTYVAFPCNDDERRIQARIAGLNQIEGEAGGRIRHLGRLNHETLYAEMGAAEYWLYPTDWPETSCITAMEMLMSGVICLYYPVAGLTETMGGCGIQVAPGSEVDALLRIAHDEPEKEGLRQRGRAYAESCDWASRAQQWVRAIRNGPTFKFKTVVINLKRRRDRRVKMEARLQAQTITDYEFMDAVDGSRLILTEDIRALFKGNDFNYRKGVIGCAMSHLALWKRLMDDSGSEVYAIMEDDAELVDNFEVKLGQAVRLFMDEPSAELCFISTNCLNSVKSACNNWAGMQVIKKNNKEVDGLGGYLIKKSGAIRFIEYYNTHSMTRAIDASIIDNFNDRLYEVNEYLIKSVDSTDTDVQGSARPITVAFCDWWDAEYGGGTFNIHDNFFVNLIKTHCGFEIKTVEPHQTPDILFYSVFGESNGAYRAGRKVFYAGEPVPHRPNADFNITFDASNIVNTRLPLWVCYFDDAIMKLKPRQFSPITKREKFCSYIATQPGFGNNRQLFVERLSAQYKRVDCGGVHLNNIGGAIPPGVNASGKIEHNKQYKFAVAFENRQYPGYVTEKICDAYKSGCIPIYWGTPDVTQDFNPNTFINANDFTDFDALIDHIRRVDCDDELYASYFKDPILSDAWMQVFADPTHAFFKQLVSDILKA